MTTSAELVREALFFLDSVSKDYTLGIPIALLEQADRELLRPGAEKGRSVTPAPQEQSFGEVGSEVPKVVFVFRAPDTTDIESGKPFTSPEAELLRAAVTKGMKLSLAQVSMTYVVKSGVLPVSDPERHELLEKARQEILAEIKKCSPEVVVALGPQVAQLLLEPVQEGQDQISVASLRTQWRQLTVPHVSLLITHELSRVIREPQVKREFWSDLQLIIAKLASSQNLE